MVIFHSYVKLPEGTGKMMSRQLVRPSQEIPSKSPSGATAKADALLHFGTHGSLEFMPGKQVGMSGAKRCESGGEAGELQNVNSCAFWSEVMMIY